MSKDMLGSLVRASVNLTQPQVNLSLDVMNRFTGENGKAWEAHLKTVLRTGLPNQPAQSPAEKPSVLKLVNGDVSLDAIATYDPSALKTRKGVWVSDDFVSRVRSKARPVENLGPLSLSSHELTKNAYDRETTPGLGKNYIWDESELCARIDQMVSKQPNGEAGDLLNNGYANLFYVAGSVVGVDWGDGGRRWYVYSWGLDDYYWNAGRRAFSRN